MAPKIAPELSLEKILMYALAHDIVELHSGDTYTLDMAKDKKRGPMRVSSIVAPYYEKFEQWMSDPNYFYDPAKSA